MECNRSVGVWANEEEERWYSWSSWKRYSKQQRSQIYPFLTTTFNHFSFSRPIRTSPVIFISTISRSLYWAINFTNLSSVMSVKYLPFLSPLIFPILEWRVEMPALFRCARYLADDSWKTAYWCVQYWCACPDSVEFFCDIDVFEGLAEYVLSVQLGGMFGSILARRLRMRRGRRFRGNTCGHGLVRSTSSWFRRSEAGEI